MRFLGFHDDINSFFIPPEIHFIYGLCGRLNRLHDQFGASVNAQSAVYTEVVESPI
jgi:hypothetical protein